MTFHRIVLGCDGLVGIRVYVIQRGLRKFITQSKLTLYVQEV